MNQLINVKYTFKQDWFLKILKLLYTWIVTLMTLNCNHILPSFVYWLCFILYRSCPICQKSCKGRYYYQHIKSHDSSSYSHICKDCGDMFLTKYKLIEHQSLVHTGEASGTFCFVITFVFSLAHLLLWRGIWLSIK